MLAVIARDNHKIPIGALAHPVHRASPALIGRHATRLFQTCGLAFHLKIVAFIGDYAQHEECQAAAACCGRHRGFYSKPSLGYTAMLNAKYPIDLRF
jgi:hypothetical protein